MSKQIEYIDTGVNWLGKIPSTWESKRIKMLTRVKRGASPRPIDNPIYFDEEGEFAWVRIADVTASERYLENTTQRLSELGSSLSVKRYPDDFFLSIAGTVGKPIITKIKCCIHDGFVYFPDLKINPEFLYYIFSTGLPYLGLGKLGTQLNLNTDTVGDIYIPIPEEKEIEKIVTFLDEKVGEIDNIISRKKRLIDLFNEERTKLINAYVIKGIKKNVKYKSSGVKWVGDIPEHWDFKKIKYVATINDEVISEKTDEDTEINYVEISDVDFVNGLNNFTTYRFKDAPSRARRIANEGDILISTVRTYLKAITRVEKKIENLIVSTGFAVLRPKEINSKYLGFIALSNFFIDETIANSVGVSYPAINSSQIGEFKIPIPPLDEQEEIVHLIETEIEKIKGVITKIEQELILINEYRTSLINEVVTGKITLN